MAEALVVGVAVGQAGAMAGEGLSLAGSPCGWYGAWASTVQLADPYMRATHEPFMYKFRNFRTKG